MPPLSDRFTNNVDMNNYEPAEAPDSASTGGIQSTNLDPGLNVFLRCPFPQVWDSQTDTLRQYYQGHLVPQIRVMTPLPPNNGIGGITNITNVTSGSSSSSSSTSSSIAITQTSVKTPSILPNATYAGSFTLSKAFQLITLSSNAPCRVRLYGTSAAQSADSYRGLDVPPPAGTIQNIICDVVLDTSPFSWTFQDRVGSNGDNPATSTIYISVTNLDATTDIFTLSFSYVPVVI